MSSWQRIPVKPLRHRQVSGATQTPPLSQPEEHTAAIKSNSKVNKWANLLKTQSTYKQTRIFLFLKVSILNLLCQLQTTRVRSLTLTRVCPISLKPFATAALMFSRAGHRAGRVGMARVVVRARVHRYTGQRRGRWVRCETVGARAYGKQCHTLYF